MNITYRNSLIQRLKQLKGSFVAGVEPIFIYSPGRVGSSAVYESLRRYPLFAFHTHTLSDQLLPQKGHPWVVNCIYRCVPKPKVITMVRDPVSMMVSDFLNQVNKKHSPKEISKKPMSWFRKLFIETYVDGDRDQEFLGWFDTCFEPITGVDIYNHDFDVKEGIGYIDNSIKCLVLSAHVDDAKKSKVVKSFLDIPPITITKFNTLKDRHGKYLSDIKDKLKFKPGEIDSLYDNKYCKHFFSKKEVQKFRSKWVGE